VVSVIFVVLVKFVQWKIYLRRLIHRWYQILKHVLNAQSDLLGVGISLDLFFNQLCLQYLFEKLLNLEADLFLC